MEERNYTGIQLIDRNDELCILYEKCNMQQTVLKSGELEIARREEEIRLLDLQVSELVRRVEVTRRTLTLTLTLTLALALALTLTLTLTR